MAKDSARAATQDLTYQLSRAIERLRSGDHGAFEEIILLTRPKIFRVCSRLMQNSEAAEELMQDVYLRAFSKIDDFPGAARTIPWLLTIAKNLFIDHVRKAETRLGRLISRAPAPSLDPSAGDWQKEEGQVQPESEERIQLHQALAQLKPEDRLVLTLLDLEEHSYAEAAEIMGITEPALRSRAQRARQAFFKIFGGA